MSELRIALVAEGITDRIIIEAALKAILASTFVLTQLQPESTRPDVGGGWCGVLKWCREFRQRGYSSVEMDPTLSLFDLVIVHLDADVADKTYRDCGPAMEQTAQGLGALPCSTVCPPAGDTVSALEAVLLGWLGIEATGTKSVFCVPSKTSDAWLASACLPSGHPLLDNLECNMNLETQLTQLPKNDRIRKSKREYDVLSLNIPENWDTVKNHCAQAGIFDQRIQAMTHHFST